jgi:hypothetical protein
MPRRPVVVIATPAAGHWRLTVANGRSMGCETLRQADGVARRLVDDDVDVDVQVSLGGLEDLCVDAVDLGEQSDASSVVAIRLRRIAARALSTAGIRTADIGYLMGLRRESAKHLLSGPFDSPWMVAGHAPPLKRPAVPPASASPGNRRVVAAVVTRDGSRWHVHLEDEPQPRASLAYAERFVRKLIDDPKADVLLCPQLPADLEAALRASELATAQDDDLRARTYELRAELARRLRALGLRARDIGDLIGIHEHRVRTLLGCDVDTAREDEARAY